MLRHPWWPRGKQFTCEQETICNAGDARLIPGLEKKMPWRRKWHPTPVFLPGKSHRQGA